MRAPGRHRAALEIGGTFTDVVAYDQQTGAGAVAKSSTTDRDLVEHALRALELVVATPDEIGSSSMAAW